jgi:hypothetical protein
LSLNCYGFASADVESWVFAALCLIPKKHLLTLAAATVIWLAAAATDADGIWRASPLTLGRDIILRCDYCASRGAAETSNPLNSLQSG